MKYMETEMIVRNKIEKIRPLIGKSGDVDQANPVQNDHPKLTSNIFFKEVVHFC
jgi:hypothetical protein